MGLNEKKFKQFNNLIKNKKFVNSLILNVSNILFFVKRKKFNSIIIPKLKARLNLFINQFIKGCLCWLVRVQ